MTINSIAARHVAQHRIGKSGRPVTCATKHQAVPAFANTFPLYAITSNMHIFGDVQTFAISYRPYERSDLDIVLAYCHLILAGHMIGEPTEACLLNTWKPCVQRLRQHVAINKGTLSNPLFEHLSDEEIFILILKSNQLEEDFDPTFSYLPQQPTNHLWVQHTINLDETVDAFIMVVVEENEKLKFIWKGWREPCPPQYIGKIFSVIVPHDYFDSVLGSCVDFLEIAYRDFQPPK